MLRKELQPPNIDETILPEVESIIEYFEEVLDSEEWNTKGDEVIFINESVAKEVEEKKLQLENLVKSQINILQFDNYSCACSTEEVAIDLLMPEAPYVSNITLEELAELINEFEVLEQITIDHENYYLRLLKKSFGMDVSDYIFWPNTKGMALDAGPIEIAKKIIEDSKIGNTIHK